MITRREFNGKLALAAAGSAIATTARSYAQIVGANDRVNFAVIGLHSRAYAHLGSLKDNAANARVAYVCDVESNFLAKFADSAQKSLGYAPATAKDFREVLASKDVDAITIATPDHWHAPMGILGLEAGKHVYVEKPCAYNPTEGELFVAARDKYKKLVQMGTQRRSAPHIQKIVEQIHDGLIGTTYSSSGWYSNQRVSIGVGKEVAVPSSLDWELWQGPAPRQPYHDNYQPYNWHWFKHWGTGETLNNGTHEIDVCRWALNAGYPNSVEATGGRYAYKDDWQFYDTLAVNWKYDDKTVTWDCLCCNHMKRYGRDRGSLVVGTKGSVIVDGDGYEVFDLAGKQKDAYSSSKQKTSSSDTVGEDAMTHLHFANFIAGIQRGEKLNQPIESGNISVTMLQLANYSWATGRILKINPANGHIVGDPQALAMTRREYAKGWEPKV